ncbi:MAG TPA: (deoxy)nucleoside triphosphate pyrophosphohydrolase [Bacteroidales bacterium]|nr:(deoxy)nucleoside triphosphate pyrophosphohydrolase [Bacteroidales bacterium]HOK75502.1 (deoxy)nucleoside triphosphate pyrophosphohydrolase [Bacteroidales bacterium]HOM40137.1 (deoxy)nucleoside triphosphate pyrophosphohydrolase [Bacteroidales bacterium]HPP93237.1 (deoxy)nucleoside triphosphate pyrophosphohydrolase [Bacteroidales bacterium]HQK71844.1 (deoxy)nucleoside triphosphate pyrophosphohydrolase [Bacteroidales bacterium]
MTDVTCAIIRNKDEKVLIVQRGERSDHPFKWEFPGGKTLHGESHEDCIIREIKEELDLDIAVCELLEPVEYDYGFKHIRLIPFICKASGTEPVLGEHIAYRWVEPRELSGVDFQEADICVAEKYLKYIELQNSQEKDF